MGNTCNSFFIKVQVQVHYGFGLLEKYRTSPPDFSFKSLIQESCRSANQFTVHKHLFFQYFNIKHI